MIDHVKVTHAGKADFLIYSVAYDSGRTVTMTDVNPLPRTVHKFLMRTACTARTIRAAHLDENNEIRYTYYVIYG